eukprot:1830028-Pyramimonas_sp.AAC.1
MEVESWADKIHGVVLRPFQSTCGAREIYFGICSEVLAKFMGSVGLLPAALVQAHSVAAVKFVGLGAEAT